MVGTDLATARCEFTHECSVYLNGARRADCARFALTMLARVGCTTLRELNWIGGGAAQGKKMSVISRSWPRVEEFWFDEPFPERGVDVAWLCQRASIPARLDSETKHTMVFDLTLPEEHLFANIEAGTRYEIRRAQKESLEFRPPGIPDAAALIVFYEFYRDFAALKGLPAVRREYLRGAAGAGALHLSSMAHNGEVIVWHAHLFIRGRARLLHSASFFRGQDTHRRSMIGRANRLLHWLEMQAFRGLGATLYDFGGWYAGNSDQELLRINRFKEGFGGTIVEGFDAPLPLTPLGRMYLQARRLRHCLRRLKDQASRNALAFRGSFGSAPRQF